MCSIEPFTANLQRMDSGKNMTLALLEYQDSILNISGQHEEIIVVRTDSSVERIDTISLGFPLVWMWRLLILLPKLKCC
jgi:serine phosphatase RsbU (regulator of sigma subunit)